MSKVEGVQKISCLLPVQDGIWNAKTEITIASLYIGTEGKPDTAIVEALACAASKDGADRPKITILLDALRSTRPSKDPSGVQCSLIKAVLSCSFSALLADQSLCLHTQT